MSSAPTAVSPHTGPQGRLAALDGLEQAALIAEQIGKGHVVLPIQGPCMRPWAFSGDHITVTPIIGPIRRGMVLLAGRNGVLFAHRVIDVRADGRVRTRGDLSPAPDPWWSPADVMGQVVAVHNRFGFTVPLDTHWARLAGRFASPPMRLGQRFLRAGRRLLRAQ